MDWIWISCLFFSVCHVSCAAFPLPHGSNHRSSVVMPVYVLKVNRSTVLLCGCQRSDRSLPVQQQSGVLTCTWSHVVRAEKNPHKQSMKSVKAVLIGVTWRKRLPLFKILTLPFVGARKKNTRTSSTHTTIKFWHQPDGIQHSVKSLFTSSASVQWLLLTITGVAGFSPVCATQVVSLIC